MPLSAPAISALPANARVEDLGLRDLDSRAEVHLVASILPIEPGGPVLSARQKVSETETAAGRQPRGARQVERSAGGLVEHRIVRREFRRVGVDGRAQRAVTRRAVQIGGDARFAFERAAREQRETAQVAGDDIRLAMNFVRERRPEYCASKLGAERSRTSNVASPFEKPSRAS